MNDAILIDLRGWLAENAIDAIIIGSEDAHQSEYVCDADARRTFVSGFTGSAGTALVLQDQALLWTDGRYYLQASQELTSSWTLMKAGMPNVPDILEWIKTNLVRGQKVGVDPWLSTAASSLAMRKALQAKGIEVIDINSNPVDMIWPKYNRPAYPSQPVQVLPLNRAGLSHQDKIELVVAELKKQNAVAIIITMLDEIAWLFNIRGSDVEYNPVVISYAVVAVDEVRLFVDSRKVTPELRQHFGDSVKICPYEEVETYLTEKAKTGKVLADSIKVNWRLYNALGEAVVDRPSPITLPKSLKNEVELEGIRNCHIRDGVALTAFIHWLEGAVRANPGSITEYDVAEKIETFRSKMADHVGPSFSTIAGYGSNGAVIHYKPEKATALPLNLDSLFLLDSGAQYRDGTTDVTRTMCFGTPTQRMKDCYTAVLKGHIALASLVIPEGTLGSRIDSVARMALWQQGLDYNHGTGHGVGAYLNVHEGPQGIGFRARPNEAGFAAGMTISNEPGYYEDGAFGVRIENVCVTKVVDTQNNFNNKRYLGFENMTMVPIKKDLINASMLTEQELRWLSDYHRQVRQALLLQMEQNFPESVGYLMQETEPLTA